MSIFVFVFYTITAEHAVATGPHQHDYVSSEQGGSSDLSSLFSQIDPAAQAQCMAGAKVQQNFKIKGKNVSNLRTVSDMPIGYFNGLVLNFARAQCSIKTNPDSATNIILKNSIGGNGARDTLSHYAKNPKFSSVLSGDNLIDNYALLFPLGMLESSGKFKDGLDRLTSSSKPGNTVETGLFQFSSQTVNKNQVPRKVYDELVAKYKNSPGLCSEDVFSKGLGKNPQTANIGSGFDAEFQAMMKDCPALAVDFMAVLLRKEYRHNGPLKRYEAQPRKACVAVLKQVQGLLNGSDNCGLVNKPTSDSDFGSREYMTRLAQIQRQMPKNRTFDQSAATYNPGTGSLSYRDAQGSDTSIDTYKRVTGEEKLSEAQRKSLADEETQKITKELQASADSLKGQILEIDRKLERLDPKDPENLDEISKLKTERRELVAQSKALEASLKEVRLEEIKEKSKELKSKLEKLKSELEKHEAGKGEEKDADKIEKLKAKIKAVETEIADLDKEKSKAEKASKNSTVEETEKKDAEEEEEKKDDTEKASEDNTNKETEKKDAEEEEEEEEKEGPETKAAPSTD